MMCAICRHFVHLNRARLRRDATREVVLCTTHLTAFEAAGEVVSSEPIVPVSPPPPPPRRPGPKPTLDRSCRWPSCDRKRRSNALCEPHQYRVLSLGLVPRLLTDEQVAELPARWDAHVEATNACRTANVQRAQRAHRARRGASHVATPSPTPASTLEPLMPLCAWIEDDTPCGRTPQVRSEKWCGRHRQRITTLKLDPKTVSVDDALHAWASRPAAARRARGTIDDVVADLGGFAEDPPRAVTPEQAVTDEALGLAPELNGEGVVAPRSPLPLLLAARWKVVTEDGDLDGYVRGADHAEAMAAAVQAGHEGDFTVELDDEDTDDASAPPPAFVDSNGVPTVAGAEAMFAAQDHAHSPRSWPALTSGAAELEARTLGNVVHEDYSQAALARMRRMVREACGFVGDGLERDDLPLEVLIEGLPTEIAALTSRVNAYADELGKVGRDRGPAGIVALWRESEARREAVAAAEAALAAARAELDHRSAAPGPDLAALERRLTFGFCTMLFGALEPAIAEEEQEGEWSMGRLLERVGALAKGASGPTEAARLALALALFDRAPAEGEELADLVRQSVEIMRRAEAQIRDAHRALDALCVAAHAGEEEDALASIAMRIQWREIDREQAQGPAVLTEAELRARIAAYEEYQRAPESIGETRYLLVMSGAHTGLRVEATPDVVEAVNAALRQRRRALLNGALKGESGERTLLAVASVLPAEAS